MQFLSQVERAEAQAEERRADAQREARDILKAVEEANLAAQRAANGADRDLAAQALRRAESQAQAEIAARREKQAAQRAAQDAQARGRLDAAVATIFERVVNDGHR
ncbi:MAG: hypothetical protein LBU67_08145 [Oscillospiraceae bacterium]|nr:hypothetical protein [Oscillospiraceae bacterium]